jgi:hypothetical protein
MRSNRVEPTSAQVAQLGERQTEDLNVPGSSPGLGIRFFYNYNFDLKFEDESKRLRL